MAAKEGMDEVGVVHPCAMPCVLELRVSDLRRYHISRRDVFVTPGIEGQVIRIIRIVRVHVNRRYVMNFRALDSELAAATMVSTRTFGNGLQKLCGGGSPSFGTCGLPIPDSWREQAWYRSNKGYIYCPICAKRVTHTTRLIE